MSSEGHTSLSSPWSTPLGLHKIWVWFEAVIFKGLPRKLREMISDCQGTGLWWRKQKSRYRDAGNPAIFTIDQVNIPVCDFQRSGRRNGACRDLSELIPHLNTCPRWYSLGRFRRCGLPGEEGHPGRLCCFSSLCFLLEVWGITSQLLLLPWYPAMVASYPPGTVNKMNSFLYKMPWLLMSYCSNRKMTKTRPYPKSCILRTQPGSLSLWEECYNISLSATFTAMLTVPELLIFSWQETSVRFQDEGLLSLAMPL